MTDSTEPIAANRPQPVSFARRGTRLTARQQLVWDELASDFVLEVPRDAASTSVESGASLDLDATFGRRAPLIVEIGTGSGEALCAAAEATPQINFLGLEVWPPGIAQSLMRVRRLGLENVRQAVVNAPEALATWLPENSADEVRIWFPDPWPKKRHNKRRLITEEFTELVARVLRPDGCLRIATDWADYAQQIDEVIANSAVLTGGPCDRFDGRPLTKFEQKGIEAGRLIHDFCARSGAAPSP